MKRSRTHTNTLTDRHTNVMRFSDIFMAKCETYRFFSAKKQHTHITYGVVSAPNVANLS